jgi:predicted Zn-dependent protease
MRLLTALATPALLVALCVTFLAAPAELAAQQLPGARAAYDQGQALAAQKRNAEAADKFRLVTALEPAFTPGWFALAFAARRAGNCKDAIPAYRHYAELRPGEAEPYYGLGLCLRDTGDRPAALVALKTFVRMEGRPTSAKWIENARAEIAAMESPPGVRAPAPAAIVAPLHTAATAAPDAPAAAALASPKAPSPKAAVDLYAQARQLRDAGRIEESLKAFREVAALDPDLVQARAAWGELLIKIRRNAEAIAVFRAALQRNQRYPLIWYELAFTLRDEGRFAEAVDAYQRYIQLRPDDPDPYYGLAKTLGKLGRAEEARRNYQTYLALEKRPSEGRWISNAQAELATLHGSGGLAPPSGATSATARDRAAGNPR